VRFLQLPLSRIPGTASLKQLRVRKRKKVSLKLLKSTG